MGASTRAAGRRDELFPVAERLERAALGVDARVLQLLERVRLHLAGTARPLRALDAHLIERLIQARLGGVDLLAQPLAPLVHLRLIALAHRLAALSQAAVDAAAAQVMGQTKLMQPPDHPLGRVELIPAKTVAIIPRKAVMEVMIALAEGEERSEERRVGKECRSRWAPDH